MCIVLLFTVYLKSLLVPLTVRWLTLKNRASYVWDGHTATLQMSHFIYFFQQL